MAASEFSISITDPGLEGLRLPGDEGHDAVVPDVLDDVVNGGAGASVLLLTAPAPNYGLSLSLCPSAQLDPGYCGQEVFSCCSHTAKYFHLKKGDLKNWLNI